MKKYSFLQLVLLLTGSIILLEACQTTKSATTSKMLKFGFEKGKGYDYEMIINTDQDFGDAKTQVDMTSYYSMDVTEDDGNIKNITTTFERVKSRIPLMGLTLEIDTDKPLPDFGNPDLKEAVNMLNGFLGAVKGRKFNMKVNTEGKVTEISGLKEMALAIADSFHLGVKEKGELVEKFNVQFSDQKVRNEFERFLYIFPNKEVKVGDSWQKTTSAVGPMGGVYTSTYTVKEIEGDMVTLDEKTKISSDGGAAKVDGEVEGSLVVDSKTGLIVNADQDMKFTTAENGKTIRITGKTKVKGKAR